MIPPGGQLRVKHRRDANTSCHIAVQAAAVSAPPPIHRVRGPEDSVLAGGISLSEEPSLNRSEIH